MQHGIGLWGDRLAEALLATAVTLVIVALGVGVLVLIGLAVRRLAMGRRDW